jgi:hypothetical protein
VSDVQHVVAVPVHDVMLPVNGGRVVPHWQLPPLPIPHVTGKQLHDPEP